MHGILVSKALACFKCHFVSSIGFLHLMKFYTGEKLCFMCSICSGAQAREEGGEGK